MLFNWRIIALQCCVSAVQECELAVGIHISRRRAWQPITGFLPGESPWAGEPGGLQSMKLQRVGQD